MVEIGTILQERYLIERQIGAGGMGAVYAAIDRKFDSHVAIKETFYTEDELREAFEREARLLNGLHHPVLPHVSDFFTEGSKYFLVMEYIEGEDLSEILKREGAFAVTDVLRWTDRLLDGLDYLHSQEPPIVHRDIKPQNLKLTPRGDIILLDFGLAKSNSVDTTGVKSVFGYSRKYSPLEQIQGTGTDARSDIFSLGATVYHLLTGKPPLDALARASAIIAGNPDPLSLVNEINQEVPLAVAQVLQAALALNADRRFISAKAARTALEHALNSGSVTNAKDLPEEIVAVVKANNQTENIVETENFPALEAFAAEAQNSAEIAPDKPAAVQIPIISVKQTSGIVPQTVDVPTVSRPTSRRPLVTVFAALAALLIWGGMAIWLFSSPSKSSPEPASQNTQAESNPSPQPTVEQVESNSVQPTTELSESQPPGIVPETKSKTTATEPTKESKKPLSEMDEESRKENRKNEIPERPEAEAPIAATSSRPKRPTNTRPAPRQTTEEIRPRVVEQPPVSSIEKVMTGGAPPTSEPQERRQRRDVRRQREQMSEAEKDELRRRRVEDILRRNNQTPPQ